MKISELIQKLTEILETQGDMYFAAQVCREWDISDDNIPDITISEAEGYCPKHVTLRFD